jgi:hypothetical protein
MTTLETHPKSVAKQLRSGENPVPLCIMRLVLRAQRWAPMFSMPSETLVFNPHMMVK